MRQTDKAPDLHNSKGTERRNNAEVGNWRNSQEERQNQEEE